MGIISTNEPTDNHGTNNVTLTQQHVDEINRRSTQSKTMMGELVFSIIKWLFASLLTINSGGVITSLGLDSIDSRTMVWAIVWFTLGIGFALLAGFSGLYQIIRLIPPQSVFLKLKPGNYRADELSKMIEGEVEPPDEWRDPMIIFGLGSFILFCIGVGVLASS